MCSSDEFALVLRGYGCSGSGGQRCNSTGDIERITLTTIQV
ncbi:hypothetical protein OK016_15455 [Vibrio chagasii]|nr:hypothetical protein [Vibrio chagasii]